MSDDMVVIVGVGAIGSWLTVFLARPEMQLLLWDDEDVGMENVGTSAFATFHVGAKKAMVASELAAAVNCFAAYETRTLNEATMELLDNGRIRVMVDCLDNVEARRLLCGLEVPVLHVGMTETGGGLAMWDKGYQCPATGVPRGENAVCTHDLNRALIRNTAAAAAAIIEEFLETGERRGAVVTRRTIS